MGSRVRGLVPTLTNSTAESPCTRTLLLKKAEMAVSQSRGLNRGEDHSGAKLQWWVASVVLIKDGRNRIARGSAPTLKGVLMVV